MRLDHLLSKEKEKSYFKIYCLFFNVLLNHNLIEVLRDTIKKYIYGNVIKYIKKRVMAHK